MKIRIIALIMIICVLFSSCGGGDDKKNDGKDVVESQSEATSQTVNMPVSGKLPESTEVDRSYFDDAAFVGDSISLKLSYYQASTSALGKAQFFASGSLSAANALWDVSDKSVHPSYQGTKSRVEDCVAMSGAKKLFIMLGMNDIGIYGLEGSIENYKELLGLIIEKSPGIEVFVQSMTPMAASSTSKSSKLNNDKIKEYNALLLEMCKENGWYFLDVASVMYDGAGYLKDSYCSDLSSMGMHFTNEGCDAWVNYLKTHAINAEAFPVVEVPEAVG